MKNTLTLLFAMLLTPLVGTATANKEPFDFDWRFANSDVAGAEKMEFDDAQWQPVDLPHDFCISGPFDRNVKDGTRNGFRPLGIGWYRKVFVTPEAKCVRLDFEGVFREAKVWVNGELAATSTDGYHGFGCDITLHLKPPGQMNVVAGQLARKVGYKDKAALEHGHSSELAWRVVGRQTGREFSNPPANVIRRKNNPVNSTVFHMSLLLQI